MIEGQVVLDLLLKWSGKGEMRGVWSDLSCVGTCLLHSGLDTPEFLDVGQQWPSSFLGHQSQEHPRNKLFKTICLLSSLLAGGLRGASHIDKCMHTSLLSATNPPIKPEVPDS